MIDTHCHLYSEDFSNNLNQIVDNFINKGGKEIWLPAIDSKYHNQMFDVYNKYPSLIKLMIGLHPCSVKPESYQNEIQIIENLIEKFNFSLIGEIGIDLYWDSSTLEIQKIAFIRQIKLAKNKKLPINIHGRQAFDEIFEILEQEKDENLKGIFHCFSGDYNQALKAISFGLKLGIGGVVTFKNGKIDQFLNQIPLEHIVLETDAPYLAPVPFRGKTNESAYLIYIIKKLSEIYNISEQEIINITTNNANSIF